MKTVYTVEAQVKIKNEVNTSKWQKCKCGSWLDHWHNFSKKAVTKCSVADCDNDATNGAHITRPAAQNGAYKTNTYIIPMCDEHNNQHGEVFMSKNNCTFVLAKIARTCG